MYVEHTYETRYTLILVGLLFITLLSLEDKEPIITCNCSLDYFSSEAVNAM